MCKRGVIRNIQDVYKMYTDVYKMYKRCIYICTIGVRDVYVYLPSDTCSLSLAHSGYSL